MRHTVFLAIFCLLVALFGQGCLEYVRGDDGVWRPAPQQSTSSQAPLDASSALPDSSTLDGAPRFLPPNSSLPPPAPVTLQYQPLPAPASSRRQVLYSLDQLRQTSHLRSIKLWRGMFAYAREWACKWEELRKECGLSVKLYQYPHSGRIVRVNIPFPGTTSTRHMPLPGRPVWAQIGAKKMLQCTSLKNLLLFQRDITAVQQCLTRVSGAFTSPLQGSQPWSWTQYSQQAVQRARSSLEEQRQQLLGLEQMFRRMRREYEYLRRLEYNLRAVLYALRQPGQHGAQKAQLTAMVNNLRDQAQRLYCDPTSSCPLFMGVRPYSYKVRLEYLSAKRRLRQYLPIRRQAMTPFWCQTVPGRTSPAWNTPDYLAMCAYQYPRVRRCFPSAYGRGLSAIRASHQLQKNFERSLRLDKGSRRSEYRFLKYEARFYGVIAGKLLILQSQIP